MAYHTPPLTGTCPDPGDPDAQRTPCGGTLKRLRSDPAEALELSTNAVLFPSKTRAVLLRQRKYRCLSCDVVWYCEEIVICSTEKVYNPRNDREAHAPPRLISEQTG